MTFFTTKEAAAYLRYSEMGMYKLLSRKKVPGAFKVGSHHRINKELLDAYIENQSKVSIGMEKTDRSFARRSKNHESSDSAGTKV